MDFNFPLELIPILIIGAIQLLNQTLKKKKKKNSPYTSSKPSAPSYDQKKVESNKSDERENQEDWLNEMLFGKSSADPTDPFAEKNPSAQLKKSTASIEREYISIFDESLSTPDYDLYNNEGNESTQLREESKKEEHITQKSPKVPETDRKNTNFKNDLNTNLLRPRKSLSKNRSYKIHLKRYLQNQPNFKKTIILNELIGKPIALKKDF